MDIRLALPGQVGSIPLEVHLRSVQLAAAVPVESHILEGYPEEV